MIAKAIFLKNKKTYAHVLWVIESLKYHKYNKIMLKIYLKFLRIKK